MWTCAPGLEPAVGEESFSSEGADTEMETPGWWSTELRGGEDPGVLMAGNGWRGFPGKAEGKAVDKGLALLLVRFLYWVIFSWNVVFMGCSCPLDILPRSSTDFDHPR